MLAGMVPAGMDTRMGKNMLFLNNSSEENILNAPTYCLLTARWQIKQIKKAEKSDYPRMAAKMFTAFMAEGFLNELGQLLYPEWYKKDDKGNEKGLTTENILKKHCLVRTALAAKTSHKLPNKGREFQKIHDVLDELKKFRDAIAHPKIGRNLKLKEILRKENEEENFETLAKYLHELIEITYNWLESLADSWSCLDTEPQLLGMDIRGLALDVRVMLVITESGDDETIVDVADI
jgi:hypothetical protein